MRTWKRDIANGREVPPGVKELLEDGVWDPCEFKAIFKYTCNYTLHSHAVKLGGEDTTKEDLLQIVKKELEKLRREHKEETQRERENKTRKMLLDDEAEDTEGEIGPDDEDCGDLDADISDLINDDEDVDGSMSEEEDLAYHMRLLLQSNNHSSIHLPVSS